MQCGSIEADSIFEKLTRSVRLPSIESYGRTLNERAAPLMHRIPTRRFAALPETWHASRTCLLRPSISRHQSNAARVRAECSPFDRALMLL